MNGPRVGVTACPAGQDAADQSPCVAGIACRAPASFTCFPLVPTAYQRRNVFFRRWNGRGIPPKRWSCGGTAGGKAACYCLPCINRVLSPYLQQGHWKMARRTRSASVGHGRAHLHQRDADVRVGRLQGRLGAPLCPVGQHGIARVGMPSGWPCAQSDRAARAAQYAGADTHPAVIGLAVQTDVRIAACGNRDREIRRTAGRCLVRWAAELQGHSGHGDQAAWVGRRARVAAAGHGLRGVWVQTGKRAQQQHCRAKGFPASKRSAEKKPCHRSVVLSGAKAEKEGENNPRCRGFHAGSARSHCSRHRAGCQSRSSCCRA